MCVSWMPPTTVIASGGSAYRLYIRYSSSMNTSSERNFYCKWCFSNYGRQNKDICAQCGKQTDWFVYMPIRIQLARMLEIKWNSIFNLVSISRGLNGLSKFHSEWLAALVPLNIIRWRMARHRCAVVPVVYSSTSCSSISFTSQIVANEHLMKILVRHIYTRVFWVSHQREKA